MLILAHNAVLAGEAECFFFFLDEQSWRRGTERRLSEEEVEIKNNNTAPESSSRGDA